MPRTLNAENTVMSTPKEDPVSTQIIANMSKHHSCFSLQALLGIFRNLRYSRSAREGRVAQFFR